MSTWSVDHVGCDIYLISLLSWIRPLQKDLQLRNLMRQLGEEDSDILANDIHSKLKFPRIVEILRIEGDRATLIFIEK